MELKSIGVGMMVHANQLDMMEHAHKVLTALLINIAIWESALTLRTSVILASVEMNVEGLLHASIMTLLRFMDIVANI